MPGLAGRTQFQGRLTDGAPEAGSRVPRCRHSGAPAAVMRPILLLLRLS